MRVLLIDVTCKVGSTGKIVYDLYTELNNQGHVAGIAFGRGPQVNEPNIFKFGLDKETAFHALMNRITGIHGSFSLISTIRLIRFIEKFNPDVIHIHELHGYFVNIVTIMKYIRKKNIKTIWTFHSEYMYEAKGHVYDKKENPGWSRKNEYPQSWIVDFSKISAKRYLKQFSEYQNLTIVTPSIWLKDRVSKTPLNKHQIKVIHNGIDQSIFNPRVSSYIREQYNIGDKKVILSVAPNLMSNHKGGKLAIEIASMLPSSDYYFILIGVNQSSIEENNNILMIPKTNNQNSLADFYSLADLFLITSIRETFPTTCLESLSCGTPVVGFDTGGTSETAPFPFGSYVKYSAIEDLKDLIINQANNKRFFSDELLKFAKKYDKKVMLSEYIKIYT